MQDTFLDNVKHYCEGIVVAVGCHGDKCEYAEGEEGHQCEPSFSWTQCDSCGSSLGGDRFEASGLTHDENGRLKDIIPMSICVDCAMFHANGELPNE